LQLVLIIFSGLATIFVSRRLSGEMLPALIAKLNQRSFAGGIIATIRPLLLPLVWLVLLAAATVVVEALLRQFAGEASPELLWIGVKLLTAWVVIRLAATMFRDTGFSVPITLIVWAIVALYIFGLLDEVTKVLDSFAFQLGAMRVSVLSVVKGILMLAVLLWLASLVGRLIEARLSSVTAMTPSTRVLLTKTLRIFLVIAAILIALSTVGIDITAIAVFSGALGVGLGFGLQKVVSNLVSGMILLMDRSIKPGDVIEVGNAFGWITKLGARYAAIVTRDGKKYLIPNEDLITQQVVNWSFTNTAVRLHIGFGVSYNSDPRRVIKLAEEAARGVGRVLNNPPPACRFVDFGDSALKFDLRLWVSDPESGVENVSSEVRLRIWDAFKANDISIPFPQQDLHIVSAPALKEPQGLWSGEKNAGPPGGD
jgi:small-conductance mechanosensitive channel